MTSDHAAGRSSPGPPRGGAGSTAGLVVAAVTAAVAIGVGALLGAATITARPGLFVTAGVAAFLAADALGAVLVARRARPDRRRAAGRWLFASSAGPLLAVFTLTALVPAADAGPPRPALPGEQRLELPTGSQLVVARFAARGPAVRPPIVVVHGGPGLPDLAADAVAFAPLTELGADVHLQVDPAAAHAFFGDQEADARNDRVLTLAESALFCSSPPADLPAVRGSGFYALQYPQSATTPTPSDPRPRPTGLPTPTLIVKGGCDYLSWRSATGFRDRLPRSQLLYVPDAGHNTHQERPAAVRAAIAAFLDDRPVPGQLLTGTGGPPAGYRGPP